MEKLAWIEGFIEPPIKADPIRSESISPYQNHDIGKLFLRRSMRLTLETLKLQHLKIRQFKS